MRFQATRRSILTGAFASLAGPALARSTGRGEGLVANGGALDAAQLRLRPGATEDQTSILQTALVEAAKREMPLFLPPGRYRAGQVVLPEGARLIGIPGATRLIAAREGPVLIARRIKRAAVVGLTLDGLDIRVGQRTGLISAEDVVDFTVSDCDILNAGSVGAVLQRSGGLIEDCRFRSQRDAALFSIDARGLTVAANTVEDCGNNGIQIWRSQTGDDGTIVRGNRLNRIRSDAGGDGPNGNGISMFRAGGVIVEGNALRDCALTFIRNNSGSGVQILGNQGRRCGETGIFSEFAYEGVIIAQNHVEDCAQGASMTNLDHGGRLSIFANNIIRNAQRGYAPKGKELIGGSGVHVEAEATVSGNVIENASDIGIAMGWSWGMRNLVATGNIVRKTGIGISVSLVPEERNAVIANNLIAGATRGAVVGTEYGKAVTGDLTRAADARASGVRVEGNQVG